MKRKSCTIIIIIIIIIIYYLFGANIYMNIFKCAIYKTNLIHLTCRFCGKLVFQLFHSFYNLLLDSKI